MHERVQGADMRFHVGAPGECSLGYEAERYGCQKLRNSLRICRRIEAPGCLPASHDVGETSA